MKQNKKEALLNLIIALAPVVIIATVFSVFFDYYYELNDDVLMKDILSGMYDGIPNGHNIQMLWPIGALVALLYRLCNCGCWYGLMLLLFQYGSLVIINYNLTKRINSILNKIVTALSVTILLASYMIFHMTIVQYTVTVSMMAGAAVSILATSDDGNGSKTFLKSNIPTIIILALGFMLRSEMMLLMMPFVCAIAVFKWSFNRNPFDGKVISGYISTLLVITGSFMILLAADRLAYSGNGWPEFVDLFNARTELYDYQVPPQYEGNEKFYDELGFTKEEAVLFENYNYGIDTKVDNDLMWQVADYAGSINESGRSTTAKLSEKIKIYAYEFTHVWDTPGSDYPWNIVVIGLYILCAIIIVLNKDYLGIWRLIALFVGRSAIWIYMLMGERTPNRITDSLYFVETVVLIFLLMMCLKSIEAKKAIRIFSEAAALILGIVYLCQAVPNLKYEQALKEEANGPYLEFYEYILNNPDNFYLMDTYSSVAYSEKMFDKISKVDKSNLNILGGWAALSPIESNKLSGHGISNMADGLLKDNVYFVKKQDIDSSWLPEFYEAMGNSVEMIKEDTVSSFEIYKVTSK